VRSPTAPRPSRIPRFVRIPEELLRRGAPGTLAGIHRPRTTPPRSAAFRVGARYSRGGAPAPRIISISGLRWQRRWALDVHAQWEVRQRRGPCPELGFLLNNNIEQFRRPPPERRILYGVVHGEANRDCGGKAPAVVHDADPSSAETERARGRGWAHPGGPTSVDRPRSGAVLCMLEFDWNPQDCRECAPHPSSGGCPDVLYTWNVGFSRRM